MKRPISDLTATLGAIAREAESAETLLIGIMATIVRRCGAKEGALFLHDDAAIEVSEGVAKPSQRRLSELVLCAATSVPPKLPQILETHRIANGDNDAVLNLVVAGLPEEWAGEKAAFLMMGASKIRGIVCIAGHLLPPPIEEIKCSLSESCKMFDLVADRYIQRDLAEVNTKLLSTISAAKDLFMCAVLAEARSRIGCEGLSFFAKDPTQEELVFDLIGTSPLNMPTDVVRYGDGDRNLTSKVMDNKASSLIHYLSTKRPDMEDLNVAKYRDVPPGSPAKTVMFLPVIREERAVGLLRCTNKTQASQYSQFNALDLHRGEVFASLLMTWHLVAEKDHRFAESLMNLSHELKTTAAGMKSAASFARRDLKRSVQTTDAEVFLKLDHIINGADSLIRMLPAMRREVQAEPRLLGEVDKAPTPFKPYADLCRPICEMYREATTQRGISFIYPGADQLGLIYADIEDFKHIFGNLISNAVKYAESKSVIMIAFRRAVQGMEYAMIHVMSKSLPILPLERVMLFRPRFRSAAVRNSGIEGEGRGLVIAQAKARQYSGDVVYSTKDGRNIFSVMIPLHLFRPKQ